MLTNVRFLLFFIISSIHTYKTICTTLRVTNNFDVYLCLFIFLFLILTSKYDKSVVYRIGRMSYTTEFRVWDFCVHLPESSWLVWIMAFAVKSLRSLSKVYNGSYRATYSIFRQSVARTSLVQNAPKYCYSTKGKLDSYYITFFLTRSLNIACLFIITSRRK